jgi:F-type H+-transporting ATPase subunit c
MRRAADLVQERTGPGARALGTAEANQPGMETRPDKESPKEALKMKKKMLGLLSVVVTTLLAASAFAQEAAEGGANFEVQKWGLMAAGLGMGIAAFGGALGQGRAAAAALDGIARNPGASDKIFTPMILGLALIESLVIYSLVISFMILGKI